MGRDEFLQLFDVACAADAASNDRAALTAAIAAVTRLSAWCDSRQLAYAQALGKAGIAPELVIAEASRSGQRTAERVVERARTAELAPGFGDALGAGRIAADHIDQLTTSLRRLSEQQRARLLADAPRLVTIATHSTPDEFARTLRAEERRLATDDGMSRLERQRRAVRLHSRTDIHSGTHIFTLSVDPLTGLKLHNKITAATEALFHDRAPEGCPTDPIEKQSFLRAHALLQIVEGKGIRLGKPEIVVVVDTSAPDPVTGRPAIDWGVSVELPERVLADLVGVADTHAVVVRNGAVVHATGALELGRTTRLANRSQRRALRAMYATCALPGCTTRFDHCKVHRVRWWRHGGATDLDNLLPICIRHHTLVHTGGWNLRLAPDRQLTVTLPDATTMTTGPPRRVAA